MPTYHTHVDVVKELGYVEETTYGTTPTSPTFTNVGPVTNFHYTNDITATRYRVLGKEDIATGLKCGELYSFEFEYSPATTTFPRYGTEAQGGGAGTIDKSLSIAFSHKLDAVENYVTLAGARTDSISLEWTPEDVTVRQNFIAKNISTPNTAHGLGASTVFASDFSGTPLCGTDAGTNPLTINSLNYDCIRFRIDINRNLDARRIIGSQQIAYLVPGNRDINIDFDILAKDNVTIADAKALTARTASMVLNSTGPKTLSLTGLQLEKHDVTFASDSNEIVMYTFSGFAKAATLTA